MVSSTTSFHDEMMQVNDIINELNIRLGKFSEVNFRKGGDEFRKLTKKDLFKDTVNESNRVNDSLTESLRKLNAMHAAGTGFTEDMEKLVNEINDINIQLGNFDKVDIKEAFFGPLRYGAKEFARDFKDEIKSVGTDFKSGLSGALKDLVRGKGSIGEVFRGAALDFLYKRLDFGIDQTVNQLGNLFAGLFKGKSGGTNVNQGDNTGATVVSKSVMSLLRFLVQKANMKVE